jgi:hypothetical protein
MSSEDAVIVHDRAVNVSNLSAVHDVHISRLLKKESDVRSREDGAVTSELESLRTIELQRNRCRIQEVHELETSLKHRLLPDASE